MLPESRRKSEGHRHGFSSKEILQRENVQQFPYVVELGNMFIKEVQAVR